MSQKLKPNFFLKPGHYIYQQIRSTIASSQHLWRPRPMRSILRDSVCVCIGRLLAIDWRSIEYCSIDEV